MKLIFTGHNDRYAIEQDLLAFFPNERPVYDPDAAEDSCAWVKLSEGATYTTATTRIRYQGREGRGLSRVRIDPALTAYQQEGLRQRALKMSFFKASVEILGRVPAWGSLTGVRPAKLAARLLRSGMTPRQADRELANTYQVSAPRRRMCIEAAQAGIAAKEGLAPNDISLYIGIPFCPTRCAYCSFVSQSVEKSMKLIPPFLEALHQEIRATAAEIRALGLRIVSVYMGGGTPTTLSAEQLDRLCSALEKEFDLSQIREYTVEAGRPDTITVEKLRVLRRHGVDRVSVNPQTMSDTVLEAIGRRHSAADIVSALEKVRQVGGFAVNMDLIAGLPTDTVQGFTDTVDRVLALSPENVTVHTLSLKKGSRITLEGSALPTAAEVGAMLDIAQEKLRAADYAPYYLYRQKFMSGGFENVGWSREGYINLYNICIMEELCSIVAMGGGGSTKLVRHDGGRNIRIMEPKYPLEYINGIEKTCADKRGITEFYTERSQEEE